MSLSSWKRFQDSLQEHCVGSELTRFRLLKHHVKPEDFGDVVEVKHACYIKTLGNAGLLENRVCAESFREALLLQCRVNAELQRDVPFLK